MYKSPSSDITTNQNIDVKLLSSRMKDVRSRKRALIDFTGAMFAIDIMKQAGLRASVQRSIFKSTKLYSDFEIVDIYCNSHMIYVLTAYAADYVKIPVMHKNFDILPEAYLVVNLKIGMKEAEIKGVINPSELMSAPVENGYYRFDINNLQPKDELFEKVKKYSGIKSSIGRHLECMNLFVPYADDKLNDEEKKKLIEHILTCETCKKRLMDTLEFDSKARNLKENGMILSKADITTEGDFIKKLQENISENVGQVKGAIDVIYKGEEPLSELKEEALKFKPEIPVKTRKLIITGTTVAVILLILVSFLANLPSKKSQNLNKEVAGVAFQDIEESTYNDSTNFEISVPVIRKNKGYITVSKVSWEVGSGLSNDEQKKFLQAAGKSIRLNLQNDLLLSNEVAVKNQVKFDIRFYRDGNLDSIDVNESSGTTAVDEIVKQSIQNTLYYMRPPKGSFASKKNGLTLVVDF